MNPIITVKTADDETAYCDETCYETSTKIQRCPCAGRNRGLGLPNALRNNALDYARILLDILQNHPQATYVQICVDALPTLEVHLTLCHQ